MPSKVLSFRVDHSLYIKFLEECKREKVSVTEMLYYKVFSDYTTKDYHEALANDPGNLINKEEQDQDQDQEEQEPEMYNGLYVIEKDLTFREAEIYLDAINDYYYGIEKRKVISKNKVRSDLYMGINHDSYLSKNGLVLINTGKLHTWGYNDNRLLNLYTKSKKLYDYLIDEIEVDD